MAGSKIDGQIAQRVAHALQEVRRGEAGVVEVRGSWDDQEVARAIVADFVQVFELDVVFRELPDGFLIEASNPSDRAISIDL
jgi:hypothetical protein